MACPEDENSTECLLRELLKAINDKDKEFNWDPLTFGFLVPIGLVAAIFGALTIIQAIWSAGSGRRRCNKIAIGRWSKLTTRRWNWHDLMFLSTAKTPLLRSNSILKILSDNKNAQPSPRNPGYGSTDHSPNGTSAATWFNFLQEINLSDLAPSDNDGNIRETAADYLPSDLVAVPAYCEIGFIVATAAAAGAYSWETNAQSPYPAIIGEDFQFDFRQHPTLGPVGAFSRYVQRVAQESPTRECLAKAIKHAEGGIDIATLFPLDEKIRKSLSLKESPISVSILELPDSIHLLRGTHREGTCTRGGESDLCTLPTYFDGSDEHLLWLFIADTPKHPPAIFPSGLIHVPNLLSILALNSGFWSSMSNTWESREEENEFIWLPDLTWRESLESIEPALGVRPINKYIGYKDIYRRCVQILYEPQAFQAWIDSIGRSKKQAFRQGVVAQLQQIDKWLEEQDHEQDARCSIVEIYRITSALLKADKAIANGSLRAAVPADQAVAQQTNPGDSPKQDTTDGPFDPDDEHLGIVVSRHFKMLTTLRDLGKIDLSTRFREKEGVLMLEDFEREMKTRRALAGISQSPTLLEKLVKLPETLETNMWNAQSERSPIETIKDVVIWRCILIYLLFSTAPDNSKVLSSGLWEHVVPVI